MEKRSSEKGQQKSYPGYPHYPAKEDVTQPGNNNGIASFDASKNNENNKNIYATENDADITREDLELLENATQNMDTPDGANLINSKLDNTDDEGEALNEPDISGELDIPGSELDDPNEEIGEEDEENNYYSLGGDNHEGLEEN